MSPKKLKAALITLVEQSDEYVLLESFLRLLLMDNEERRQCHKEMKQAYIDEALGKGGER